MKLANWVRFSWETATLAAIERDLPEHYEISRGTAEDEKELRKVIASSFVLDPEWNATIHEVTQSMDAWLDRAFANDSAMLLALRHGTRIIGAANVSLDPEDGNHLAPGPCILTEYRNRGFGTHLLAHSLGILRDAGIPSANGIAKANSPAAKFLYPKFQGVATPFDFTPLVAA